MNRFDLLLTLQRNNIDSRSYSIYGVTEPPEGEQYVFTKEGKNIITFYLERGERNNVQYFIDEDEASRYFLEWLLKSPENQKIE